MANNIKFSYLYRDGGNYKNYNFLIFSNPSNVDLSELTTLLQSKLIDNTWFYVNEWRLPDLHFNNRDNITDPTWHEFESIEYTDEPQNTPLNLDELISEIRKTHWYSKFLNNPPVKIISESCGRLEQLTKKAKDLADELTNHNVIEKGLTKQTQIAKERVGNYAALRSVLLQRGVNLKAKFKCCVC
jgi:hypothetical protein